MAHTSYWSRFVRIGTAAATASTFSDDRPRHMLAAVATAVRCTLVWKKSRNDSTASSPPCLSTDCNRRREAQELTFQRRCSKASLCTLCIVAVVVIAYGGITVIAILNT